MSLGQSPQLPRRFTRQPHAQHEATCEAAMQLCIFAFCASAWPTPPESLCRAPACASVSACSPSLLPLQTRHIHFTTRDDGRRRTMKQVERHGCAFKQAQNHRCFTRGVTALAAGSDFISHSHTPHDDSWGGGESGDPSLAKRIIINRLYTHNPGIT